jgi:uncharacterized protein (DUF1778 family)
MSVRTERLGARISGEERDRIERAASAAGTAASATAVPADHFDDLLAVLDEPDAAPGLSKAVKRSRRISRIAGL